MHFVNNFNIFEYNESLVMKRIQEELEKKNLKISNIGSMLADGNINENPHINASRQTLYKALKGKTSLPLGNVIELCKLLQCSISYLVGETEYTSNEKHFIGQWTGLSEDAINVLTKWVNNDGSDSFDSKIFCELLSEIITHPRFYEIFEKIQSAMIERDRQKSLKIYDDENSSVKHIYDSQADNNVNACLYNASRIFTDIIEEIINLS